jgi:hypothetical protein
MSFDYSHIWNKALHDIFMYFDIDKNNIETKIIEYRQSNDYKQLSLLEKAYLIVELDKMKKNVKETHNKYIF